MPNLPLHIGLAQEAAAQLRDPVLDANSGYMYLGCTSPDIRVITKRHRSEYHFAGLDFGEVGAGVEGMFRSYPGLQDSSGYDAPTRAFMAGYISHLMSDETWVVEMYRPYFGNPTVFEDTVLGSVMDRALQLDLDRQSREAAEAALPVIEAAANGVDVEFIPSETLSQWHEWVTGLLQRDFTWERLRFMASRIAPGDDDHPAHDVADEFLSGMPQSLERLYEIVPQEVVEDFRARAVANLVDAMGQYLS